MGDDDEAVRHGAAGGGLAVHVVVFVAVNLLLIGVWGLFTKGADFTKVPEYLTHPGHARDAEFFPVYVMMFWGTGLLIHTGVFVAGIPRRRRKRRERARRAKQRRQLQAKVVGALPDGLLTDAAVTGIKLVDGDKAAAKVQRDAERDRARRPRRATRPDRQGQPDRTSRAARRGERTSPPPVPAVPPVPSVPPVVSAASGSTRRDGDGGRQWMAVMFTDIVDSTPLTEHFGDDEWARLLGAHRAVVRECIAEHGGVEVGTQGDGFLVRFDTPDAAVAAAIALQRHLAEEREERRHEGIRPLHVRIGIHAGEVVQNDDDLVGRVINLAARVTSAAEPDEILVTEPLADHLTGPHPLVDRGLQQLKGFDRPRHLLALAWQPAPDEVDLRD